MSKFPTASFAIPAIVILAMCILVAASPALRAYWVPDGIPVCTWFDSQSNPDVCSNGMGGAFVVWEDDGAADYNLYARLVTASGNFVGLGDGVDVCWAAGDQRSPAIVPDGAGGAFIAWQDGRSGNDDIYIQRLSASGSARWTANGVVVCAATGGQTGPRIIPDGGGGVIVVWQDNRASGYDVYAQRLNAAGTALWTANGVAICAATGSQYSYAPAPDGTGGVIVAWADGRSGNYDIYAQRVNHDGSMDWTANGVALCTATGGQFTPVIAADGAGGAIVAWADQRGTTGNVFVQRVSASGSAQWAANGIAIYATKDADQGMAQIASDGAGGAVIVWGETRSGNGIYAQRVNASGARQWQSGGVTLAVGLFELNSLFGAPDGSGGLMVTWPDFIGEAYDVFAQRVSVSGTLPWGATQTTVCSAIDDQSYVSIAPDGAGGAIIAWRDGRSGGYGYYDIYAQLVDAAGRVGWIAPEIASVSDVPGDQGGSVFLAWDAARADRYMEDEMSYYSIWRSIDVTQAAFVLAGGAPTIGSLADFEPKADAPVIRVEELGALTTYWQLVDTHEALNMEGYGMPVATLFDSTAYCDNYHYFQVVAHTTDPHVFWKSTAAVGRSIDNLPPGAPLGLDGERRVAPFGLNLTWDPNTESDFSCYALYRGLSEDFVPGALNLVGQLDETEYFDGEWNWGGYYYKLSAIDINGNESPFALFSPDNITGDETPKAPAASYLAQNFPNPFNPTTRILFGLAAPADVSLRIYDAAGRLVRALAEDARPAGNYSEIWDGRDSGGRAVSSGIYFYRLTAGSFTETRKMALLR